MAPQSGCVGSQADEIAMESLGRIRLNRAPEMKYKDESGPRVGSIGRVVAYFRQVIKETDNELVRA